jgi:hypothetical protein
MNCSVVALPYACSVSQRRIIALNVVSLPRISRIASIVAGAPAVHAVGVEEVLRPRRVGGGTRQEIGYRALA